jgi:hypothetical protein
MYNNPLAQITRTTLYMKVPIVLYTINESLLPSISLRKTAVVYLDEGQGRKGCLYVHCAVSGKEKAFRSERWRAAIIDLSFDISIKGC